MFCLRCVDWQAVSAIGTLLAVCVALGWPAYLRLRDKPRLQLSYDPVAPYVRRSTVDRKDVKPDHWQYARLMVHNDGNIAAEHVEVYLSQVVKHVSEQPPVVIGCDPGALTWANINTTILPQLPRDAQRLVSLGHLVHPTYRSSHKEFDGDDGRAQFTLDIGITQKSGEHVLEAGRYSITLHCQAANSRPSKHVVLLEFDEYNDPDIEAHEFFARYVRIKLDD